MNKGIVYSVLAYIMWGSFPLFFKLLAEINPLEVLSHRFVWSLVVVAIVLSATGAWGLLRKSIRDRKTILIFACTSLLIAGNWGTYIYTVQINEVIQGSLGYFINPLMSIALACIFLKEKLRWGQWIAIAFAVAGVLWMTLSTGRFPWFGIALALTFSFYGLLKKIAPLPSVAGLAFETAFLTPLALVWIVYLTKSGQATFGTETTSTILLILAGPITALPLLLFSAGAKLIPYSTMGLIQYVGPTIQFFIGVLIFKEPFGLNQAFGFSLIWTAVALFVVENIYHRRHLNTSSHQS